MLTRYGVERLLYRLSQSAANDRLVLKGARLFYIWEGGLRRPTRDVDFLGYGDDSPDAVGDLFRRICSTAVEPDGLAFHEDSICAELTRDTHEYVGVRVHLTAKLGTARIPLQIDIGFGDAVTPGVETAVFPALLDLPSPKVRVYPPETVIAEKLEAMVSLGMLNTRLKDFYDVFALSKEHAFDGATLVQAIAATLQRRNTPVPSEIPTALNDAFGADATKRKPANA